MSENLEDAEVTLLKSSIKKGNKGKFSVSGLSMSPFFKPKDKVVVASKNRYYVGDIVVFMGSNKLVVHRILLIFGRKYFTKGDHNLQGDGWIRKKDVLGVVESVNGVAHNKVFKDYVILVLSIFSIIIHDVILFLPRKFYHFLVSVKKHLGIPSLGIHRFFHGISEFIVRKPYYAFMSLLNRWR